MKREQLEYVSSYTVFTLLAYVATFNYYGQQQYTMMMTMTIYRLLYCE